MMRIWMGWLLWILILRALAQTLVVAGCESEWRAKMAEQLIEQTRKKGWQRSKWVQQCRQAGFEVVGDTDVLYLIPANYTPEFAERAIIPLIEHLLKQSVPICRLKDLSPELQQAILFLSQRPQLALFVAQEPSAESLHSKLLSGEILIGIGDVWWFQTTDDNGEESVTVFAECKRYAIDRKKMLSLFSSSQLSERSVPPGPPSQQYSQQKRWWFIFSHPLQFHQQVEHMKAYLEWLSALQHRVHTAIPIASKQLWKMFYPDKAQPQAGSSYSLDELRSLLGEDARLLLPSEQMTRLSNRRLTLRKWDVGLEFIKRTPDGRGTTHHFLPLEVLLGLRDY